MKKHVLATLVCASLAVSASAETLLQYNFDGPTLAPTTTATNVNGSSIVQTYGGVSGTDYNVSSFNGATNIFFRTATQSTPQNVLLVTGGEAAAISASHRFSFTVAPGSGYELDLSSLSFQFGGQTTNSGTTDITVNYSVYQLDGINGSTVGSSLGSGSKTLAANAALAYDNASVGLTSGAFQNLTSDTHFGVFVWMSAGTAERRNLIRVDTVTLDGSVATAIPEPSTYAALAGVAMLGFAALRRRRAAV